MPGRKETRELRREPSVLGLEMEMRLAHTTLGENRAWREVT